MKSIAQRYKGMTYAAAAEKIEKKYKDKNSDSLQDKAYQEEMKLLIKMHEEARASLAQREVSQLSQQPQQPMMKEGGKLQDPGDKKKKKQDKPDSVVENVIEIFDPTGIASWDDASDAYDSWISRGTTGMTGKGLRNFPTTLPTINEAVDMAGAIPMVGKVGKGIRFIGSKIIDGLDAMGDIYEDNIKGKSKPDMKKGGNFPDKYKKMGFSGVDKPKKTPGASKSHAVVVKDGDSYKLIRFGQQGVSGAGSNPKSDKDKARQKSFKARHAKNIAKGKTSAAYWADKEKWKEGGWAEEPKKKLAPGGLYDNQYDFSNNPGNGILGKIKFGGGDFGGGEAWGNFVLPQAITTPITATAPKPGTAAAATTTSTKPAPFTFQTIPGNPLAEKVESMYPTKIKDINYKKPEEPTKGSNAYLPSYIGQGLEALTNLGLIASSEKRSPVFNPYESEVRQKMDSMRVDLDPVRQSIQSNVNAAVNKMSSMSRSAANLKSNLQNIYANMNNTISNVDMQQQQQLNQIRQSQASTINSLGVNKQQAITLAKEINDRNRAAVQSAVSKLGSQATDFGKFMTRMKVNEGQNLMTAKIYSDMFRSFGIDSNFVEKVSKGDFSGITDQDMIKLKEASPDMHKQFSDFLKQQGVK